MVLLILGIRRIDINYLDLDKNMFFSIVNMKLRDYYSDIEDFCLSENVDIEEFNKKIKELGYKYDKDLNKLVIE